MICTATNPALPFLWRNKGGGRERLTRIRNGRERLYQDTYINQLILCPSKGLIQNLQKVPLWELLGHCSSAGNLSVYVKIACVYGWGEHNKGLHAATTQGIHIFWAPCYPTGQQKATFRSQATLRETKPIKRGVGIIKREERWKGLSSPGELTTQ